MAASEKKPSLIQRMTPSELIDLRQAAADSADDTTLPGHISGPNDALRHIIGAAELRRRYGPVAALAILEANEFRGNRYDKQTPADEAMDRHNNDLGIALGTGARSYKEIVERPKALVAQGIAENGTGMFGTPVYLPKELWRTSNEKPDHAPIPEEFLERARNAPPRRMPEPATDPETGFGGRARRAEHGGNGGDVTVTAYTRDDGTRVDAHSRAAPARKAPVRGNRPKPKIKVR